MLIMLYSVAYRFVAYMVREYVVTEMFEIIMVVPHRCPGLESMVDVCNQIFRFQSLRIVFVVL